MRGFFESALKLKRVDKWESIHICLIGNVLCPVSVIMTNVEKVKNKKNGVLYENSGNVVLSQNYGR